MARGYEYLRRLDGGVTELVTMTVGAVAVKYGDACKIGAAQDLVIPITTVKDKVVGVATHDAAIGAEVSMVRVDGATVFKVATAVAAFVLATYQYLNADSGFVSGAMVFNPATLTTTGDIKMLDLAENSADNVIGNHVQVVFLNRYLD
jgi:hypothetical protein